MYGLLLLAAAPGAVAADELACVGKFRAQSVAQAAQQDIATLQGLLVLRAGSGAGPEVSLDTATAQVRQQGAGQQGDGQIPQFRVSAARTVSPEGVAFDLPVGDLGEFQLTLRTERSESLSAWSLGGTLEMLAATSKRRQVAAIPTLRIHDMHGREVRYLAFDASLRTGDAGDDQLAFRWRI